jgi:hypothetical protein
MPTLTVPVYSDRLISNQAANIPALVTSYPWNVTKAEGSDNGTPVTGPQIDFDPATGLLDHNSQFKFNRYNRRWVDYDKMRVMRRDPTIALAREIAVGPTIGSSWTIEVMPDAPDDAKAFAERYLMPFRKQFLKTALYGEIDFGWRVYEKVLNTRRDAKLGVVVVLDKLKPLFNDTTWVKYNSDGDYDGVLHQDPNGYGWCWIDREYALFANFDDDGLGAYQDPRLVRCESAYDEWNKINDVSKRYNEKMAGAVWVVHYPEGRTMYKGVMTDHSVIARDIVYNIKASGYLTLPSKLLADAQTELQQLGQSGWRIEIMESSSKQADFIAAMEYQDKLKARGLGVLERAMMEGQYGTKAEAESHVNVMLLNMQLKHEDLTELFNKEVLDPLLTLNYNAPGSIKFIAQPLTDERYELFNQIFNALMADPSSAAEIIDKIDVDGVFDHLRIPMKTEHEQAEADGSSLFAMIKNAIEPSLASALG